MCTYKIKKVMTWKQIILMNILFFVTLSCTNKDVIVRQSNKNCNCIEKLQEGIVTNEFCQNKLINCDIIPFTATSDTVKNATKTKQLKENYAIFSKTNSIELVNTSKTKVYSIVVQTDNEGVVTYDTHILEPTTSVALGCDSNFNVSYDSAIDIVAEEDCYDTISLSNLSKNKIKYSIKNVSLVFEY